MAGGVGGAAAAFLESNEPTCNFGLNFLRIPSLWYFQNCLDASLPATLWRTVGLSQWIGRGGQCSWVGAGRRGRIGRLTLFPACIELVRSCTMRSSMSTDLDVRPETWSRHTHLHRQ